MKGSGLKKNLTRVSTVMLSERRNMKMLPPWDGYSPEKKMKEKIVRPIKLAITPYITISVQYYFLRSEFYLYFSVFDNILKMRTNESGIKYSNKHKLKLPLKWWESILKCSDCRLRLILWWISSVFIPYPEEYFRGDA